MDDIDDEDLREMNAHLILQCSQVQSEEFDREDPAEAFLLGDDPADSDLLDTSSEVNLFEDPAESDLFEDPAESDLFKHPKEEDLLEDPAESDLFEDPAESDLFKNPKEEDLLEDPAESDLFEDPAESDLFKNPSEENLPGNKAESDLLDNPSEVSLLDDPIEANLLEADSPGFSFHGDDLDLSASDMQDETMDINGTPMDSGEAALFEALEDQFYSHSKEEDAEDALLALSDVSSSRPPSPTNDEKEVECEHVETILHPEIKEATDKPSVDHHQIGKTELISKSDSDGTISAQSVKTEARHSVYDGIHDSRTDSQEIERVGELIFDDSSKPNVEANKDVESFLPPTRPSNQSSHKVGMMEFLLSAGNDVSQGQLIGPQLPPTDEVHAPELPPDNTSTDTNQGAFKQFLDNAQQSEWQNFLMEVDADRGNGLVGTYSGKASIAPTSLNFFNKCCYNLNELQERLGVLTLKDKPKEGKLKWYRDQLGSRDNLIREMNSFITNLILRGRELEDKLNDPTKVASPVPVKAEPRQAKKRKTSKDVKEEETVVGQTDAATRATMENYGYTFVEETGMFYDPASGQYYDPNTRLYFDVATRTYFYYDAEAGEYKFHSSLDDDGASEELRAAPSKGEQKEEIQPSPEETSKGDCLSPGEEDEQKETQASVWSTAPCLRIVVVEEDDPSMRFHMVTIDGGFVGRNKENAVILDHPSVEKIHAEISYKSSSQEDHHYYVKDLGSNTGTWVSGRRLSNAIESSEEVEVGHGWDLKCGDVVMKCHIHPGNLTCAECDIGFVFQAKYTISKTKETGVEKERRRQVKIMRKKFALSYHEDSAFLAKDMSEYRNRARERRTVKGSTNPYEKTETASVTKEIPKENVGFKMLKQMGWSEGQALGLVHDGRTEPVLAEGNVGYSGLGADQTYVPNKPTRRQLERKRVISLVKIRYDEAPILEVKPTKKTKRKSLLKSTAFKRS